MSRIASRVGLALAIIALLTPILAVCGFVGVLAVIPGSPASTEAFVAPNLYVDPDSKAKRAAASARTDGRDVDAEVFEAIAQQPTGIWLVPERNPIGQVGPYVRQVTRDARLLEQTVVFVIYGVPDRDCGNQSAGGLTESEYGVWIREIADAVTASSSVIILEPDSLALADECGNVDRRLQQIGSAVQTLSTTGTSIYLDGGHSFWHPPTHMADLLNRAGVGKVRGFATNVSNYNNTSREVAYAEELSNLTGGAHYVIDVGRNGNGSNGEWCNPSGRALGTPPRILDSSTRHDANLWIKNPGESDGTCNGGPSAGEWWPEGAHELWRNAGW